MLERTRLRDDVIDRLKKAETDADENVYRSRLDAIPAEECPAICVYTLSEVGARDSGAAAPTFNTNLTLKIDVHVAATDGWDDDLDDICEQVETALLHNAEFVKQYSQISSYSTSIQFEPGGEIPVASAVITIGLIYTSEFEPIITDDYKITGIKTESDGPVRIEINHEQ